jgi:hypothetical protein
MTDNADDLTLEDRQEMQQALAGMRKQEIKGFKSYRQQWPNEPTAGGGFAQNIINIEMQMAFNAAAVRKLEEANPKPPANKLPPSTPFRHEGH